MTPRPRRHLFLALVGTSLFAVLALLVWADFVVVRIDGRVATATYHFTMDHPALRRLVGIVTDLGDGRLLNWVGTVPVVFLLLRRESIRALVWAAGGLASWWIVPTLKAAFERKRPEFADLTSFSFPSGHAFGAATAYGLVALFFVRVLYPSRWRWPVAGVFAAIIVLVGLSRILLGVHYLTDVLAGIGLGLGWAFYCAALADWWDLRRLRGSAERVEQTQDPA